MRFLEPFGEEVENGRELREKQDAVARVDGFQNDFFREIEFGRRNVVRKIRAEILREKDGMAACLAEADSNRGSVST